jgi:hypothetical protein
MSIREFSRPPRAATQELTASERRRADRIIAQQEEDAELTRAARQSRMDAQNRGRSRSRDPTARGSRDPAPDWDFSKPYKELSKEEKAEVRLARLNNNKLKSGKRKAL